MRFSGEDQRHGEHGDEPLLARDVGLEVALFLAHIDDGDRLAAIDDAAEQRVLRAEVRLLAVELRCRRGRRAARARSRLR